MIEARARPTRIGKRSVAGGEDGRLKQKNAMVCLLRDKQLASELIRLYSNNADLRESQRKLALAIGHKPPRPKRDSKKPHKRKQHAPTDFQVALQSKLGALPLEKVSQLNQCSLTNALL